MTKTRLIQIMFFSLTANIMVLRLSMALGNICFGISILCFLYLTLKDRKELCFVPDYIPYLKAAAIFFLSTLPSALLVSDLNVGVKTFAEMWIYRSLPAIIVLLFVKDRELIKKAFVAICIALGINVIVALRNVLITILNRTTLTTACIFCCLLTILTIIIWNDSFNKSLKKYAVASWIITLIGIIATLSRSAWLTVLLIIPIVSLPYFNYKQHWKRLLLGFLAFMCIAGFFTTNTVLSGRFLSITNVKNVRANVGRIEVWKASGNMFKDHPVLGIGLGKFQKVYHEKYWTPADQQKLIHAHNNLIHIAVENGIIGVLGFVYFIIYYYYLLLKDWFKSKNPYTLMMLGIFSCFNIYGIIEYMFDSSSAMKTFWFAFACLLVLRHQSAEKE